MYREKLSEVKKSAQPIFLRMAEGPGGERQKAVDAAKKTLVEVRERLGRGWGSRTDGRGRVGVHDERGVEMPKGVINVWCGY